MVKATAFLFYQPRHQIQPLLSCILCVPLIKSNQVHVFVHILSAPELHTTNHLFPSRFCRSLMRYSSSESAIFSVCETKTEFTTFLGNYIEAVRTCLPPPGIQIALQCSSPPTETDFLHRLRGNQAHGSWMAVVLSTSVFLKTILNTKFHWVFGYIKTGYSCGIALPLGKTIANRDVCSSKKVLCAILSHSQFGTFCFAYENTMALQVQEGSKV